MERICKRAPTVTGPAGNSSDKKLAAQIAVGLLHSEEHLVPKIAEAGGGYDGDHEDSKRSRRRSCQRR
jgi:hypothetical protein